MKDVCTRVVSVGIVAGVLCGAPVLWAQPAQKGFVDDVGDVLEGSANPAHLFDGPLADLIQADLNADMNSAMFDGIGEMIVLKYFTVQPTFRNQCGCSLKAAQPRSVNFFRPNRPALDSYARYESPIINSFGADIDDSPNQYNNVMLGDSITELAGDFTIYTPGYGIVNAGVGGATSEDLADWLDFCASQNPALWTGKPHAQAGCGDGVGNGGRFACNPPPGAAPGQIPFGSASALSAPEKYQGYVQFQNRNVYIMIGGNDFAIKLYKSQMETLPALIPFRHLHVGNQINKAITYVQHQANTRVTLVGYPPFPSYYPGSELDNPYFNLLATLSGLGLYHRFDEWFEKSGLGYSNVKVGFRAQGDSFKLINGECVDTTPPPPPVHVPVIVENANAAPTDRPDAAVTNPTYEPPPAAGLTDTHMLLIALCFLTGICAF